MREKLLLCVSPYIPLVKHYAFSEIQLGPSLIKGVIDSSLFDTDFFDLDLQMNMSRGEKPILSSRDLFLLSNTYFITTLHHHMDYYGGNSISELIKYSIEALPAKNYDYALFSIPIRFKNISTILININFTCLLAKELKKLNRCKVIVGGSVFKYIAEDILHELVTKYLSSEYVDFMFFDEDAIETVPLLLNRLRKKQATHHIADVALINKRLIYKKHTCVRSNLKKILLNISQSKFSPSVLGKLLVFYKKKARSILNPLELIRAPDFDVLNKQNYAINIEKTFQLVEYLPEYSRYAASSNIKIFPLRFSKGCPHSCYFCVRALRPFLYLSPQKAIDMLERVLEKNPDEKYFRFLNSQINFSARYAISLADEIIRRKLKIFFIDSVNLRNPSEEVFDALNKAGCVKLWAGMESLSPSILKASGKHLNVDEIYKSIEYMHRHNICIGGNIITGFPFEKEDDHICNIKFIREFRKKVTAWDINIFILYPYAPYYILAKKLHIKPLQIHSYSEANVDFEEMGSHSNGQRASIIARRFMELQREVPEANELLNNDYLCFYLYSRLAMDKDKIYETICAYYAKIKNDKSLSSYLSVHNGFDHNLFDSSHYV